MKQRPTKGDKKEVREEGHLTRPPRLEGKVKEAKMRSVRKRRKTRAKARRMRKPQGYTEKQRKDYQLTSKRRR